MREIQDSSRGVRASEGESVIQYGQPVEASIANPVARRSVFLGLGPVVIVLLLVGLSFLPLARVAMEVAEWGLLFAWFGSATLAIALGVMGYHRARTPGVGGRLLAVVGIVLGGVGLLVLGGLGYMHMQLDALYGRTGAVTLRNCSGQLEVIGWACADYAAKHGGRFPPSVVELYARGGLNAT